MLKVASQSDTVVTMLPNNSIVSNVYTGSDGIFSTVKAGTLLIDSSTVDPALSKQLACQVSDNDCCLFGMKIKISFPFRQLGKSVNSLMPQFQVDLDTLGTKKCYKRFQCFIICRWCQCSLSWNSDIHGWS